MSLLDRFNKVKEKDETWDVDEGDGSGMQIVSVNAQSAAAEERIDIDAEKVINSILDLGTKINVSLYRDRQHPNVVEFRWIAGRVVHRYRVQIQDVKLIKLRV